MRKLIYGINLSIDGCCDHTKLSGDEYVHDYFTQLIREADLMIYGRKTYQLMVPFWPDFAKEHSGESNAMTAFAQAFNAIGKLVFSTTLAATEEGNTRIVNTDPKDEILKLKQQKGKDILTGGVSLPAQLIESGLIDEFRIVVQPALVGSGRRLLEDVNLEKISLQLIESKVFKSGTVALRYLKS